MILDYELLLTALAGDALTADAAGSKTVDLGQPGDALGGNELTFYVVSKGAGGSLTSIQAKLQTSADNSNWTDLVLSPDIVKAEFVDGKTVFRCKLMDGFKRYVRAYFDVTGTATGTTVLAFLTKEQ